MTQIRIDIEDLIPHPIHKDLDRSRGELLQKLSTPILEAVDSIIMDGKDEVVLDPSTDPRLEGHPVRAILLC